MLLLIHKSSEFLVDYINMVKLLQPHEAHAFHNFVIVQEFPDFECFVLFC
jgi:hypothetical protein